MEKREINIKMDVYDVVNLLKDGHLFVYAGDKEVTVNIRSEDQYETDDDIRYAVDEALYSD